MLCNCFRFDKEIDEKHQDKDQHQYRYYLPENINKGTQCTDSNGSVRNANNAVDTCDNPEKNEGKS